MAQNLWDQEMLPWSYCLEQSLVQQQLYSQPRFRTVFSSCSLIHKKEHFTLKDFLTLQTGANYDEVF